MTALVVDWCSYEAAKYAVLHWHYSKSMPAGKLVKVGAWEDGQYIGCVLFGRGANNSIGRPYGLKQTEVSELVRIALQKHASPVSQIAIGAIKLLRRHDPGLRLLVSYADPRHDHAGGIYQAMNWIYAGKTEQWKGSHYWIAGKLVHGRTVRSLYGSHNNIPEEWSFADPEEMAKHKYLYPLDRAMRRQIEPLAQSYPKKQSGGQSVQGDTPGSNPESQVQALGSAPSLRELTEG